MSMNMQRMVSLALVVISSAAAAGLDVHYGAAGLESLRYGGHEFLAKGQDPGIRWTVPNDDPDVKPTVKHAGNSVTRQVDKDTVTWTHDDLVTVVRYTFNTDVLRFNVTFRNQGDRPIEQLSFNPLAVQFPRRPSGTIWKWGYTYTTNNNGAPGLVEANFGSAKLLACVDDIRQPVTFGFQGNECRSLINPIMIGTPPGVVIKPGKSISYRFSLRFAPPTANSMDVARDLYDAFAKAYPDKLKWDDRRPVGALFMCQSAQHWPTNPRGWFNDPNVDVTTEEGLKAFGDRLMKYADTCIDAIKATGGQGMICWDPEGEEMPHALTYLGDPRVVPRSAPEFDRYADAFFERFRAAGLKTGVCIRPSKVIPRPAGGWMHQQVDDPVAEMADKITYAKKRWGCTIFYMDTNVMWPLRPLEKDLTRGMWQGNAHVLAAAQLYELTRLHPDVLIFPEFGSFGYFSCCMPYGEVRGGNRHTGDAIKAIYPRAGTTLSIGDGPLEQNWDQILKGAVGGDIHLFRGWFGDPINAYVRRLATEATYVRASAQIRGTALSDPSPAKRYAALARVQPDHAATVLAALAKETDWVVQRKMVDWLGTSGSADAVPVLVALLKDKTAELDVFAGLALGRLGKVATPALMALLASQDGRLQQVALSAFTGYDEPAAHETILELTSNPEPAVRVAALRALGAQKSPACVDQLLAIITATNAAGKHVETDLQVLTAAAGSLGQLQDKRAIVALVGLIERSVTELHDNHLRLAVGEALEALTGLQYGPYEYQWRNALKDGRI